MTSRSATAQRAIRGALGSPGRSRRAALVAGLLLLATALAGAEAAGARGLVHTLNAYGGYTFEELEVPPRSSWLSLAIVDPRFLRPNDKYWICSTVGWNNRTGGERRDIRFRMEPQVLRDGENVPLRVLEERRSESYIQGHRRCLLTKTRLRKGDVVLWRFGLRQVSPETPRGGLSMRGWVAGSSPSRSAPAPADAMKIASAATIDRAAGDPPLPVPVPVDRFDSATVSVGYVATQPKAITPVHARVTWVFADEKSIPASDYLRFCVDGGTGRFSTGPAYRVDVVHIGEDGRRRIARLRRRFDRACKTKRVQPKVGDIFLWRFRLDEPEYLREGPDDGDTGMNAWFSPVER